MRRVRRKTSITVRAADIAQQQPRRSRALSGGPVLIPCRDDNVFRSFPDTQVIAIVASFFDARALGRFLRLETRVWGGGSLWRILLQRVSYSACAPSARSARATVSSSKCGPCPAGGLVLAASCLQAPGRLLTSSYLQAPCRLVLADSSQAPCRLVLAGSLQARVCRPVFAGSLQDRVCRLPVPIR